MPPKPSGGGSGRPRGGPPTTFFKLI
jgi:hypothetical protein